MRKRERNICATHVWQLPRLGFLPQKYCKVGTEASLSSVDTEDTEVLGEPCPVRALIPAARTRRCFPISHFLATSRHALAGGSHPPRTCVDGRGKGDGVARLA